MELIYLWVEKFKNIEKQGFNFSPKFRCEYNPENNELKIEEKDYTPIFPENINITAIVGKNGSGKSNILHLIIGAIYNNKDNWRKIDNVILVFKKHSKYIIYNLYSSQEIIIRTNFSYILKNSIDDEIKSLYYLLLDFSLPQQNIWNDENNYKKYYSIEPSRFYKTTGGGSITSKIEPSSFDSNLKSNMIYFYWYINKYNLEYILEIFKLPKFTTIICYGKTRIGRKIKKENFEYLKDDKIKILDYDFGKISSYTDIKCKRKTYNLTDLTEDDLNYLEYLIVFLNIEMESENGMYFLNLSTGQKILISYFGLLLKYFISKKEKFDNSIVLIDEVEVYLHPEWQKKFIFYLITFIQEFGLDNFYSQLILATHSPFIISDLPKENIIFLNKDENGKCIVVDGLNEKKETFGANIHTLLSDSFFMEDGLIGEFAKSKIDEVIKYLNNEDSKIKNDGEAQRIINIIGEPIIKKELQRMLDSKRLTKVDKIKEIEEEIELLKHRLEVLRNNF